MKTNSRCLLSLSLIIRFGLLLSTFPAYSQRNQEQGHSIGSVTTQGNLIVMELNENALGKANLFALAHRTLRFTPSCPGYRAENLPLKWDSQFGIQLTDAQVALHQFTFPFSGKKWDSFSVGTTGSITFGATENGGRSGHAGGFPVGRFDQLSEAATSIMNTVPGISVFLKPRMSGSRYVKELADRAVITWDLTEPWGGIQDFTWKPTTNRFQAVLRQDGSIEMSYDELAARDAIVGRYPLVNTGAEKPLAALPGQKSASAAPYLDLTNLKVGVVDGLFLKITFETRGPALPEGDPALSGLTYRVYLDSEKPKPGDVKNGSDARNAENSVVWTVRGFGRPGRNGAPGNSSRYAAFGPGLAREVKVSGNSISIQGSLPADFRNAHQIFVSAEVATPGEPPAIVSRVLPRAVSLSGVRSAEVHLSSVTPHDGPFTVVYEAFHYLALPNPRDLTCSVINALGDHFDLLAYYSDFRIDNQEAGTPSNGPLGGNVTGIGQTERGIESFCSAGQFQWQFIQPVYVGSNQMQERPPAGTKTGNDHDVDFYDRQLGGRWPAGTLPP